MKKRIFILLMAIIILTGNVRASGERKLFKVGMEAAYAPYNWTQTDDSNGAVPIEGSVEYANGYDVQIARIIAEELGMDLVIVKIEWDGLAPAVQSGKIDAIIAGMSPTSERKEQIDFTDNYYESNLVLVTLKDNPYASAKKLQDFKNARVVGQLNTFHDTVIDQIVGVNHITPMSDFSSMRVALESGKVDAYVTEKPEAVSAEKSNDKFKMIELEDGFKTSPEDTSIAIGLKKGSELLNPINEALKKIPVERQQKIMDGIIASQLKLGGNVWTIFNDNKDMFARGVLFTLVISFIGTLLGLIIGMFVGIIRTIPKQRNVYSNFILNIFKIFLNIYVQVFRATPMIVQAMIFYYGLQQFFDIDTSPLTSAFIIVSINTGAYMAEVVRGGITSIDKGQFEAANSLGMSHFQTMFYVVLPQAFKNVLPSIGNEFIVNIKDTSVLNVISVQELFFTTKSIAGANFRYFETYAITSIIYLVLTLGIAGLLHLLERKMMGPKSYEKAVINVMKSSN
ncbi:MAG: ABC transporter permease subunit [Tissierellia bacterium]|nr:ABC transporter permease subunit [Tissierellia bacterium]